MAAFTKGYSSPFDLVQLLKSQGLIINDEQRAEVYIQNIGYYRLSAYMHIFLLSEIRFRVMKALSSIAFNEFKGSLSLFYAFTIKDTNSFLETVKL